MGPGTAMIRSLALGILATDNSVTFYWDKI